MLVRVHSVMLKGPVRGQGPDTPARGPPTMYLTLATVDITGLVAPLGRTDDISPGAALSLPHPFSVPDLSGTVSAIQLTLYGLSKPFDAIGTVRIDRTTFGPGVAGVDGLFDIHYSLEDHIPSRRYGFEQRTLHVFAVSTSIVRLEAILDGNTNTSTVLASCSPTDPDGPYLKYRFTTNHVDGDITLRTLDVSGVSRTVVVSLRSCLLAPLRRLSSSDIVITSRIEDPKPPRTLSEWSTAKTTTPIMTLFGPADTQPSNTRRRMLRNLLLDTSTSPPFSHSRLVTVLQGTALFETSHALTAASDPAKSLTLESFRTHHSDPSTHLQYCFDVMADHKTNTVSATSLASLLHNSMLQGTIDMSAKDTNLLVAFLFPNKNNMKRNITSSEFRAALLSYPVVLLLAPPEASPLERLRVRCALLHELVKSSGCRRCDVEAMERIPAALLKPTATQEELKVLLPKFIRSLAAVPAVAAWYNNKVVDKEVDLFELLVQWVMSFTGERWDFADRVRFLSRQDGARAMSVQAFAGMVCRRGIAADGVVTVEAHVGPEVLNIELMVKNRDVMALVKKTWEGMGHSAEGPPMEVVRGPNTPRGDVAPAGDVVKGPVDITVTYRDVTAVVTLPYPTSVRSLKKEILRRYHVPTGDQILLPNAAAIEGLHDGTTLDTHMSLTLRNAADTVTLRVRAGQSKRVMKITLPLSSTVLQLKHDVHQAMNIPLSKMVLCHGDAVLTPDRHALVHFQLGPNAQLTAYDGAIPSGAPHAHLCVEEKDTSTRRPTTSPAAAVSSTIRK